MLSQLVIIIPYLFFFVSEQTVRMILPYYISKGS